MATVTEDVASELELPEESGALVERVEDGGPAEKAGLRATETDELSGEVTEPGDLIVAADGEPVRSADDVVAAVAGKQPGDTIELELLRGDDRRTVRVKLGERPDELGAATESAPEESPEDEPLFP
jgi:S1-C subfamily serine protease